MAGTGVILRRTVVHRGEIIELVLHGVRGDRVRHLCSGVVIENRAAGDHSSKKDLIQRGGSYHQIFQFFRQRIRGSAFIFFAFGHTFCYLFFRLFDRPFGDISDLFFTDERQCFGFFGVWLLLDPKQKPNIYSNGFCFRLTQLRGDTAHLLRQHLDQIFRPVCTRKILVVRIQLLEPQTHGVLPRLTGHARPRHAAVHRRFGAAGIVAVDAAGRHGLQHVEIDIEPFVVVHDRYPLFLYLDAPFGCAVP